LVLLVLFVQFQHFYIYGLVLLVQFQPAVLETGPQDSWGIGFIVFFGTVSAFGTISVGFIGFIGTVSAFDTIWIELIGFL
jgi:hypothetical protein